MSPGSFFENLGRSALILLIASPIIGFAVLALHPAGGDGWAASYLALRDGLLVFSGLMLLSFIAGILGIFYADKYQTVAKITIYIHVFFYLIIAKGMIR